LGNRGVVFGAVAGQSLGKREEKPGQKEKKAVDKSKAKEGLGIHEGGPKEKKKLIERPSKNRSSPNKRK